MGAGTLQPAGSRVDASYSRRPVSSQVFTLPMLFTSISPFGVDLIGSLVYAVVLPYVGIATTLLYFDLLERFAESPEPVPARRRALGWWRRMRAKPAS